MGITAPSGKEIKRDVAPVRRFPSVECHHGPRSIFNSIHPRFRQYPPRRHHFFDHWPATSVPPDPDKSRRHPEDRHNDPIWTLRVQIHDIWTPKRRPDVSTTHQRGTQGPSVRLSIHRRFMHRIKRPWPTPPTPESYFRKVTDTQPDHQRIKMRNRKSGGEIPGPPGDSVGHTATSGTRAVHTRHGQAHPGEGLASFPGSNEFLPAVPRKCSRKPTKAVRTHSREREEWPNHHRMDRRGSSSVRRMPAKSGQRGTIGSPGARCPAGSAGGRITNRDGSSRPPIAPRENRTTGIFLARIHRLPTKMGHIWPRTIGHERGDQTLPWNSRRKTFHHIHRPQVADGWQEFEKSSRRSTKIPKLRPPIHQRHPTHLGKKQHHRWYAQPDCNHTTNGKRQLIHQPTARFRQHYRRARQCTTDATRGRRRHCNRFCKWRVHSNPRRDDQQRPRNRRQRKNNHRWTDKRDQPHHWLRHHSRRSGGRPPVAKTPDAPRERHEAEAEDSRFAGSTTHVLRYIHRQHQTVHPRSTP